MTMTMEQIRALAEEVEDHYQTVTDEAEANFGHAEYQDYPSDIRGDYRRDVERMEKYYDKFLGVLEMIEKKGVDEKRANLLQDMLDNFYNSIETVQASNGMFRAFLDEGLASKVEGLFELLTLIVKGQQKTLDEVIDDLEEIEKLLRKAKKEVGEVKFQLAFNLAAQAIMVCVPAMRGVQAVYLALGTAGIKLGVDAYMGPKGPTNAGAVKNTALDYLGAAREVGKTANTVANVYSTLDTLGSDSDELGKAQRTVAIIRKKLAATQKQAEKLHGLLRDSQKDLTAYAVALEKSVLSAHKALDAFDRHEVERAELVAEAR